MCIHRDLLSVDTGIMQIHKPQSRCDAVHCLHVAGLKSAAMEEILRLLTSVFEVKLKACIQGFCLLVMPRDFPVRTGWCVQGKSGVPWWNCCLCDQTLGKQLNGWLAGWMDWWIIIIIIIVIILCLLSCCNLHLLLMISNFTLSVKTLFLCLLHVAESKNKVTEN